MRRYRRLAGFTYLGLLLFIAIAGIGLAAVGQSWHTEMKREKETELLFIGSQFRRALVSYYESTPSGPKQYPATLQELLRDARTPKAKRLLRRIYVDPMTGRNEWGLVKQNGRIVGVYSLSQEQPLKTAGFDPEFASLGAAKTYSDWRFGDDSAVQMAAGTTPSTPKPATTNPSAPSPSTEPSPPVPMSVPVAIPEPTALPPHRDFGREQECLRQRIGDAAACTAPCQAKLGEQCSQCLNSMMTRYNACLLSSGAP